VPPSIRSLWASPGSRWSVMGLSVALLAAFTVFDLRSGGMERNFSIAHRADLAWVLDTFGPLWVYGGFVLNLLIAVSAALLMTLAFTASKSRRDATVCSTSAVAPVAIGFGAFTCPGCILPVTGLLGASVAGTSLPLLGLEFKVLALAVVVAALVWVARASRAAGHATEVDATP
jgi:hypothetical protein